MRLLHALVFCFTLFFLLPLRADVVVMVHGWAANADTWLSSGVHARMLKSGWQDAGMISTTPGGISHMGPSAEKFNNSLYRVHLPAQAPMLVQASHLHAQLDYIRNRHVGEKISIVAHSAGGIVARLVLIKTDAPEIDTLITIASPHLGSHRAVDGLDIAHSKPFFCPGPGIDLIKNIAGGDRYRYLRDSSAALVDLVPESYGGILAWLNRQIHPDINYHSIIKQTPGNNGDEIVPAFSQDMNQVEAIRGRSVTHMSVSSHALNPGDGELLVSILQ